MDMKTSERNTSILVLHNNIKQYRNGRKSEGHFLSCKENVRDLILQKMQVAFVMGNKV